MSYGVSHGILAIVLALVMCGCGQKGEVRGRIVGKVTFNGQTVSDAVVLFSHKERGVNMSAKLQPDGSYEIITANVAGLPLGEYRVCVCPPPSDADLPPDKAAAAKRPRPDIPAKYRTFETSGLTLTVEEGDNPFNIDMKP